MLPIKLYSVFLLVLFSVWHGCLASPVRTKEPMTEVCVSYAQALLDNITDALTLNSQHLHKKSLFKGIDCTKQSLELNTNTETPSVCAPEGSTCSGVSPSKFNQELCVHNIGEDLRYYYKFISAHPDPDRFLNNTVLLRLRELMMNCFSWAVPEETKETSSDRSSSYDERLSLCKELKGFQVRAVTINRAIGYMQSVGHKNHNCCDS